MSKDSFFGTELDKVWRTKDLRVPGYAIYIWNPNRTTLSDVVLGEAESPRYDITHWVVALNYTESIVFENNEDSLASSVVLELRYDAGAVPIEITERTLLDETPIRIYQGDRRVPIDDWVPIFTGILRGNPTVIEDTRQHHKVISVLAAERSELYLNSKVTARSYEKGEDIGKVAVEMSIEFMGLNRREINVGFQGYPVGHPQSQVVDIQVMKGLAQVLFPVGKKPKFDAEGFLIAADTDLDKPPARVHTNKDLIIEVTRQQRLNSIFNSVRLRGMDANLTAVVERDQRLAHGNMTTGYFEDDVNERIWFSEKKDRGEGGRRAKDTRKSKDNIGTLGNLFGQDLTWSPNLEADGFTTFSGNLKFNTGAALDLRITLTVLYVLSLAEGVGLQEAEAGLNTTLAAVSASNPTGVGLGTEQAPVFEAVSANQGLQGGNDVLSNALLVGILVTMTELGRVDWEISGKPFQNVYQEIIATAQLRGVLTEKLRELELRNDWLYDIDVLEARAKELLRREIAKGHTYKITMLDDPLLEVDDILQVEDRKYYVTEINKRVSRVSAPEGTMEATVWRIR
jgi:hypothetical protein